MDDRYSREAQRVYQPFAQQAESAMRGRLADQGLLSSSGGQGAVQQTGDEWRGRMIDYATQQGNTMRTFGENQRQFNRNYGLQRDQFSEGRRQFNRNYGLQRDQFADSQSQFGVNAGMRAWELANAAELGRAAHSSDYDIRTIQDPSSWRDLFATRYQTGDPAEQRPKGDPQRDMYGPHAVGRSAPLDLKPNVVYEREFTAEQNAAQRALQERLAADELAYKRQKDLADQANIDRAFDADTDPSADPWDEAYNLVMANVTEGRPISAFDLIEAARMRGIDLRSELTGRHQNPRALAFLRLAAGEEDWRRVFEEITGQSIGGGGAPAGRPSTLIDPQVGQDISRFSDWAHSPESGAGELDLGNRLWQNTWGAVPRRAKGLYEGARNLFSR